MKIKVAKPSDIPQSWYGQTIGFDIETSSEELTADICLVSLYSPVDDVALVIGIDYYLGKVHKNLPFEELEILKKFLPTIQAVGHYLQFDLSVVQTYWGIKMSVGFDTFILSRMLQMDSNGLKDIYSRLFPDKAENIFKFKQIIGNHNGRFTYNLYDASVVRYSGLDAVLPFRIMGYYKNYLAKADTQRISGMEMKFVETSADIKATGVLVDFDKYLKINDDLKDAYYKRSAEFSRKVGFPFRCNSSADIEKIVVGMLNLVPPLKTKKGKYSMSTECLEMMADMYDSDTVREYLEEIIELKHQFSVINSIKKVPDVIDGGSRMHPTVEQIGYDGTSRVYTSDPSVQQLPAEFRDCIIPQKGKKFLYMDWSGAEMYIAAYWSKCQDILSYFEEGMDPHTEVSKRILGKSLITKEERATSKVVTFATFYGSQGAAVARALHCSNEQGANLVQKYLSEYPEIKELRSKIVAYAHKNGFTRTMFRRYRRLPNINSFIPQEVEKSERQAFNTAIQNSCADFYKTAVNKYRSLVGPDVRFVIGVFDSLLFEVPEDFSEEQAVSFLEKLSDFSDLFPGFKFRYKWAFGNTWKECSDKT